MARYALVVGIAECDSGLLPNLNKFTADAQIIAQNLELERYGSFQEVRRLLTHCWNIEFILSYKIRRL